MAAWVESCFCDVILVFPRSMPNGLPPLTLDGNLDLALLMQQFRNKDARNYPNIMEGFCLVTVGLQRDGRRYSVKTWYSTSGYSHGK